MDDLFTHRQHYPDHPGYQVGEFTLYDSMAGAHKVWIENGSGEGGDFDATELEALIDKYYDENF